MHGVVIIQVRMGSSRLPGKAMLPLDGTAALVHEINRANQVAGIDLEDVVVATSEKPQDDILAFTACDAGATVYRGAEEDVLGRIAGAVKAQNADFAIRMCGDNTLISPQLLATLKHRIETGRVAYASSKFEHTFPIGHNADAFTADMIAHAAHVADSTHNREHIAQFFKENRNDLDAVNVRADEVFDRTFIESIPDFRKLRLTLDEADDYRLLFNVYDRVQYDSVLDTRDAITHIIKNDLRRINANVEQEVW